MELDADLDPDPHFKVCGSDTLPGKRAGSEGIWTPGKDYLGVFLEVNALLVQFIIKSIIFIFYIFIFIPDASSKDPYPQPFY